MPKIQPVPPATTDSHRGRPAPPRRPRAAAGPPAVPWSATPRWQVSLPRGSATAIAVGPVRSGEPAAQAIRSSWGPAAALLFWTMPRRCRRPLRQPSPTRCHRWPRRRPTPRDRGRRWTEIRRFASGNRRGRNPASHPHAGRQPARRCDAPSYARGYRHHRDQAHPHHDIRLHLCSVQPRRIQLVPTHGQHTKGRGGYLRFRPRRKRVQHLRSGRRRPGQRVAHRAEKPGAE